jgi:hypothetical protein
MPLTNSLARGQDAARHVCANTQGSRPGGTVNQRLLYNRNAKIQTGRLDAFGNIVNTAMSKIMSKILKRALFAMSAAWPEKFRRAAEGVAGFGNRMAAEPKPRRAPHREAAVAELVR